MMNVALKCLGFFVMLICLLSITINKRSLFSYFYAASHPIVSVVQDTTESIVGSAYKATSDYTRRLFGNSHPRFKDSVKSKMSATQKAVSEPLEEIHQQEKAQLDDLIKTHK